MIFEIDNVQFIRNNKSILNGVYLKAESGRVTGLIGRNGSGKSTLFDIIFGNIQPKYKSIRVDGQPISKSLYKTGLVGYLPQTSFLPNRLRLKTLFKLFSLEFKPFLEVFSELQENETSKVRLLSSGQRRLLETYLILKGKYKMVLLDEPFSGLSPIYCEKLKKLIVEEKTNKLIIISDQYYEHVEELAEDLYLMRAGYTIKINNKVEIEDYGYLNPNTI